LRHKGKGILILLLLSLITIIVGYYLLLSLSPDATLEEAVRRAWAGTILTLIGGILVIIYLLRRAK